MTDKKYLFVVGCPRSGTTALGLLLAQNPMILMGIERFGHRAFKNNFSISPELFESDRFCDFREGDTFYSGFDFAPKAYADVVGKLTTATWRGDKIPMMFDTLPELFGVFGSQAKVIFIFRNIFDVAASYNARRNNKNDNWHKGTSDAIKDWNHAISAYRKSTAKDQIIPVIYENFFSSPDIARKLHEKLGIANDDMTEELVKAMFKRSEVLESERARALSRDEVMEIMLKSNFGGFREIVEISRSLFDIR